MAQYFAIKKADMNAVLFFQVGGFYQTYYYDAELTARILQLKLISRAVGGGKRAPMCGFPKAAGEKYAECFAENGYRVALCAQTDERNEQGHVIRRIEKTVAPKEGVSVEIAEAWKEYLQTHTFDDLKPSRHEKKQPKPEMGILAELESLDLDMMTPMAALQLLHVWRQKFRANRE